MNENEPQDVAEAQQDSPLRPPHGPLTHITGRSGGSATPPPPTSDPEADTQNPGDSYEPGGSFSQFIRRSATPVQEEPDSPSASVLPKQPRTLVDVGLSKAFLTDLALKIIHYSGTPSLSQLTRRLGLGTGVVQQLVAVLTEENLVEVMSQSDLYTGNYRYRLSERGSNRAAQALDRSRYAGPAPVTAEQYAEAMRRFHSHKQELSRSRVKSALNEVVLDPEVADAAARALFSGKATLLYGPSGNGKTSILERYVNDMDGFSLIPYSIYAYGQTIRVFDQSIHEPLEDIDAESAGKEERVDRRWVVVRRPAVVLGAEIGSESLEMAYDPQARFYQAPAHIKAQGGVLVIDDFGRQKTPAPDLLTRLLIPLERGWDTLTLVTGEKLTVPFGIQLLLGTNIPTRQLADDSLLRRILYKLEVPGPPIQEFTEILRRLCLQRKVLVADGVLDYVAQKVYNEPRLKPRASYARDLLEILVESASFDGRDPVLDAQSFDAAFRLFVSQEGGDDQQA